MQIHQATGAAIALAIALALAPDSQAVSFAAIDELPDIIEGASLAFRGDVVNVDYREIQVNGRAFPYTETQFRAAECFNGCVAGGLVSVRQMGGKYSSIADRAVVVAGLPDYAINGDYFVFADHDRHALLGARFGSYGVFRVATIDGSDRALVFDHAGAALGGGSDGVVAGKSAVRCTRIGSDQRCAGLSNPKSSLSTVAAIDAQSFSSYVQAIVDTAKRGPDSSALEPDASQFELALQTFLSSTPRQ